MRKSLLRTENKKQKTKNNSTVSFSFSFSLSLSFPFLPPDHITQLFSGMFSKRTKKSTDKQGSSTSVVSPFGGATSGLSISSPSISAPSVVSNADPEDSPVAEHNYTRNFEAKTEALKIALQESVHQSMKMREQMKGLNNQFDEEVQRHRKAERELLQLHRQLAFLNSRVRTLHRRYEDEKSLTLISSSSSSLSTNAPSQTILQPLSQENSLHQSPQQPPQHADRLSSNRDRPSTISNSESNALNNQPIIPPRPLKRSSPSTSSAQILDVINNPNASGRGRPCPRPQNARQMGSVPTMRLRRTGSNGFIVEPSPFAPSPPLVTPIPISANSGLSSISVPESVIDDAVPKTVRRLSTEILPQTVARPLFLNRTGSPLPIQSASSAEVQREMNGSSPGGSQQLGRAPSSFLRPPKTLQSNRGSTSNLSIDPSKRLTEVRILAIKPLPPPPIAPRKDLGVRGPPARALPPPSTELAAPSRPLRTLPPPPT